MKKFPETQKVAVLATSHITIRDADLLEALIDGLSLPTEANVCSVIDDSSYGYWIYVQHESVAPQGLKAAGFSDAFVVLVTEAKKAGFTWLRLDCDGEESEAFPTFEWPTVRQDVVDKAAKQFRAIFAAQINRDSHALGCLVRGLQYGVVGKLGAHAAELIRAADSLGVKMSRKATYDYLFNPPLISDDEFFLFTDDGEVKHFGGHDASTHS